MPSRSVITPDSFAPSRRAVLTSAAAGVALVATPGRGRAADATKKGDPTRHVAFHAWSGAQVAPGPFTGTRTYSDPFASAGPVSYEVASWTSPVVEPGFALTELVASWDVDTPGHSWVEIVVRGVQPDGAPTPKDYVLARWCALDPAQGGAIHRTTLEGQGDTVATVFVDTFATRTGFSLASYQLELRLLRPVGSTDLPVVRGLGAMASALPDAKSVPRSPNGPACGTTLDVPTYSQEVHIGHYPEWDNGGEAWCSPTSTAMVVDYWGAGPSAAETAWVDPPVDAQVDFTARSVYDYTYGGAGNWPFNTAYATTRGLAGFVTRLRSLAEAELFIAAGIPLVASVSFKKGELKNAGYGTNGHLMVIVGFTEDGDVVCNDPASHLIADNGQVRVVYDRESFENVWVPHSGGIVYVVHPVGHALPARPVQANW